MMEKKSVLIVDDDEAVRLLCQEVLSEEGYLVTEAEDGSEAITKVEQEPPDLVILDIHMARMDGIEALPQILRKKRDLPVILYTGYSQYQEDFMAWSADAYVMKSSDLTEMKEKIEQLLSARYPDENRQ
jgi:two-component system response regulator (stage 0 sporulation protein F)